MRLCLEPALLPWRPQLPHPSYPPAPSPRGGSHGISYAPRSASLSTALILLGAHQDVTAEPAALGRAGSTGCCLRPGAPSARGMCAPRGPDKDLLHGPQAQLPALPRPQARLHLTAGESCRLRDCLEGDSPRPLEQTGHLGMKPHGPLWGFPSLPCLPRPSETTGLWASDLGLNSTSGIDWGHLSPGSHAPVHP